MMLEPEFESWSPRTTPLCHLCISHLGLALTAVRIVLGFNLFIQLGGKVIIYLCDYTQVLLKSFDCDLERGVFTFTLFFIKIIEFIRCCCLRCIEFGGDGPGRVFPHFYGWWVVDIEFSLSSIWRKSCFSISKSEYFLINIVEAEFLLIMRARGFEFALGSIGLSMLARSFIIMPVCLNSHKLELSLGICFPALFCQTRATFKNESSWVSCQSQTRSECMPMEESGIQDSDQGAPICCVYVYNRLECETLSS